MEGKNKSYIWIVISGILVIALILVSYLYYTNLKDNKQKIINQSTEISIKNDNILSLWTESSKLKTELVAYINTITDKNSNDRFG